MYNKLISLSILCVLLSASNMAFGMEQELKIVIHYNNKKINKWFFYPTNNADNQPSTCPSHNVSDLNSLTIDPGNHTLHYNDREQSLSLNHSLCNDLYQNVPHLNITDELSPKLIKFIDKKLSQPDFHHKKSKIFVKFPEDNTLLYISSIKESFSKRPRSKSTPSKSTKSNQSNFNTDSDDYSSCSESRDNDPTNINSYM